MPQHEMDLRSAFPHVFWEAEAGTLRCRSVSGQLEALGFPGPRWRKDPRFLVDTLFSPERERFLESCRSASEGHPSIGRYQVRSGQGTVQPFQLALSSVHQGSTVLLRGQMVGMTPEEEEALLSLLGPEALESRGRLVARFDRQLRHRYVSPSIQRFEGIPPSVFLGKTNEELGMPSRLVQLWNEQLLQTFRTGCARELEFQLLSAGKGSAAGPMRFHSRLIPEFDEQGQVCTVLSVAESCPAPCSRERSLPTGSTPSAASPGPPSAPPSSPGGKPRASAMTAEERLAWVEQVGRALISHQDKQELLQSLEALALPLLGDVGGVELLREHGLERMVLFPATAREERGPWTRPFPFLTRVLHGTRPQLLSGPQGLVLQAVAQDEEHLRQLQQAGLQAFLAVPLLRGGKASGCLWFASTDPSRSLGAAELALAEQLALFASPAVEAARLRRVERELRQREAVLAQKTEALRRVAAALGEALLPAQVAGAVMGEVKAALSARAAIVYRLDADGTALELLNASGYEPAVTRQYEQLPLTLHSPVTHAVKQKQSIWVESGEAFRREYPELAARFPTRTEGSWVALPLIVEARALGVLAMSFDTSHHFAREERSFALALAQLCAQALERVRLYHQLQVQLGDFRTLLDVLPVGIGIARDRECRHIEPNPALARMLGLPPEQNVSSGAPEEERVPGLRVFQGAWELEPEEMPLQRAAATGRHVLDFELEVEAPGRPRLSLVSFTAPLLDKDRRPRGAIGAFLDITERKRAAEAQRFLARGSAELSASLEPERAWQTVTRLCVPMLGRVALLYEQDGGGALLLRACAHEEPELEAAVREAAYQGRLLGASLVRRVMVTAQPLLCLDMAEALGEAGEELRRLQARLALGSLMVLPLQSRGRTLGVLVCGTREPAPGDFQLARDFSERAALAVDNARLYQRAREATALREQFLAVASHELKTPLTALRLGLESLSRRWLREHPELLAARIEQCQRQGMRLGRLVDDLLDVSRLAAGRLPLVLEELELTSLVEEVLGRMALQFQKAGCTVSSQLGGPLPGQWDRMRVEQVLTNLLGNAVKYGAGHPIEVSLFATPEEVLLRVTDHGIGIAPEDQARIFQRFVRAVSERHYGGLGLGLWITREIVTLMGGRIELQSAPGEGSTFTVYLPRQGAASVAGAEVRALPERPSR